MRSRLLVVILAAVAMWAARPALAQDASKPLTAEQWRADLRFMMREIQTRHANPYHEVTRAELEKAAAALDADIPKLHATQSSSA